MTETGTGCDNFFVLTGASGAGKSSIIAALKAAGQVCVEEQGRRLVQEALRDGSGATPWQNPGLFMERLLARSVQAFDAVTERSAPVFFDRGIPECLGHARGLPGGVQPHHRDAVARCHYNRCVFVAPPWREIYATDAERRHSFEQGVAWHQAELAAYLDCGYELVEVPRGTVEERADFVLRRALQRWQGPCDGTC
jgi:predicted ATPase